MNKLNKDLHRYFIEGPKLKLFFYCINEKRTYFKRIIIQY